MKQTNEPHIVIFGATSAIAQEVAKCYAKQNAHFYLIARSKNKLEAVANDLQIRGAKRVMTHDVDLSDFEKHKKMIAKSVEDLGRIDCVILAHGILAGDAKEGGAYEAAEDVFRINFLSYVSLLMPIAEYLEGQGSGTIAVISSVAGDRGRQSNFVYGSSKAALDCYAAGLRNKLFPAGVHVITVKPGFVSTPMTAGLKQGPLFAQSDTVGRAIYQAIQKKKDVVYVPFFWRFIMMVIKAIPECLFKRLKL